MMHAARLLFLLSVASSPVAFGLAPGAIKLDNYTIDKFLGVPGQTVLIKFDESYAYGEKEDAFKALCKLAHPLSNFFIGEIAVQEYGDKENEDVAKRFEVTKEMFPTYFLFKEGEDKKKPTKFEGFADPSAKQPANWDADEDGPWEAPMLKEINTENLVKWLRMHGIKMPMVGGIPELDAVVKSFFANGKKDSDVEAAQKLADGDHKDNAKAANYPKIMKKIKEKGDGYVETETTRVKKIMAGKITPEKKEELENKLKVLNIFASKDEL